jgi:DNA-binding PadR family transcriptional regulator
MSQPKYLFQRKKISFTKRLFEKGLNVASLILFSLKEGAKGSLEELPNSYPAFKIWKDIFGIDPKKKKFKRQEILVNLSRLEKQGLIRKEPKRKIYILTEEGKELVSYVKDRYSILDKKWDGKLKIVIFDIPEKKKFYREWLRGELLLLNYKMVQKSVYVGKYPLAKSFYQDIIRFGLNDQIFVFTINKVDKKDKLMKLL